MSNTAHINAVSLSTAENSWRATTGITTIQSDGRPPAEFFAALSGGFPEVNTIRVDFNIYTLTDPEKLSKWADFMSAAVDAGYKLIIQNSDGAIANNEGHIYGSSEVDPVKNAVHNPENLGGKDALKNGSSIAPGEHDIDYYLGGDVEYIDKVSQDWGDMLAWFHQPENKHLLDAVYGWELLNEPMVYKPSGANAELYSIHMSGLIEAHSDSFGDKKILVGGLNYSGSFAFFSEEDLNLIRGAAQGRLVWSAHWSPGTVVGGEALEKADDSSGYSNVFLTEVSRRLGNIMKDGVINDDIIITETHLDGGGALRYLFEKDENGNYLLSKSDKDALASFNMQQNWHWLAEKGIGVSWWPPFAHPSSLLQHPGRGTGWSNKEDWFVFKEAAAMAHEIWSHGESPETLGPSEHYGTSSGDSVTVGLGDPSSDHVTRSLAEKDIAIILPENRSGSYGLYFGFGGNDTITGSNDTLAATKGVDMLYGGDGNDVINGLSGDDWLFGGSGNDTIYGGLGNDVIIDRAGGGEIRGGAGDDYIQAAGGKIYGEDGNDTFLFANKSACTAVGGAGADTFALMGSGTVTVQGLDSADKLSLAFWADDPQVRQVIVKMHLDGKGQQTGDILITNEHGGTYRVTGSYTKAIDFSKSYLTDTGDIRLIYKNDTQPVDGKFHGINGDEIITMNSSADYWGEQGHDIFIASSTTTSSTRIRDFGIKNDDIIDLSAWHLTGFDALTKDDRLTGKGAQTNQVVISDGAGHSLTVELYDIPGVYNADLGKGNLTSDMFIF